MSAAPRLVVRKIARAVVTAVVSIGVLDVPLADIAPAARPLGATALAAGTVGDVETVVLAALSARVSESVVTRPVPTASFGVGNNNGVTTRTAAIKTTARTIRRGSMNRENYHRGLVDRAIIARSRYRVKAPGPERMTAPDASER